MEGKVRAVLTEDFPNTRIPCERLDEMVTLSKSAAPNMFFMGPQTPCEILSALVRTLNDESASWRDKEGALSVVAHMSAVRDQRTSILEGLDGLNQKFDEALMNPMEAKQDWPFIRKSTIHLVIILERIQDYRLRAPELLEFLDGNVELALVTIKHVVESQQEYEMEIMHGMCRLLLDFSIPGTYFDAEKEKFNPLNYLPFSIAAHSIYEFPRIVDYVCSFCLSTDIVNILVSAFARLLEDDIANTNQFTEFIIMGNVFLTFLLHLHQQSSGTSGDLRQYLNSSQKTIYGMLVPYLTLSMEKWIADQGRDRAENHGRAGFVSCLKVLILCTFRVNPAHKYVMGVRAANPTASIIQNAGPLLKKDLNVLSLLLCFNVNIDSMASAAITNSTGGGTKTDPSTMSVRELKATLMDRGVSFADCYEKSELIERVRESTETAAMPNDCTGQSLSSLLEEFLFADPATAMHASQLEQLRAHLTKNNHHNVLLITRDLPTYRVIWKMLGSEDENENGAGQNGSSSDTNKFYDPNEDAVEMQDLSKPPDTNADDEAAAAAGLMEDVGLSSGEDDMDEPDEIEIDSKPFDNAQKSFEKPSVQTNFNPSSLSDLPALSPSKTGSPGNGGDERKKKKKKDKARKKRAGGLKLPGYTDHATPPDFCCAINKHMMKDPVRSPHGHVFERETIRLWLDQQGSICPITKKELKYDQLVPDEQLKQNILAYNVQLAMKLNEGNDDDYDLYNF